MGAENMGKENPIYRLICSGGEREKLTHYSHVLCITYLFLIFSLSLYCQQNISQATTVIHLNRYAGKQ